MFFQDELSIRYQVMEFWRNNPMTKKNLARVLGIDFLTLQKILNTKKIRQSIIFRIEKVIRDYKKEE